MLHRTLVISRESLLIGLVALQQEDGIIHGHRQLQHRGQGLGDIRYLSQHKVTAQVIYDRHTDIHQENEWSYKRLHRDQKH